MKAAQPPVVLLSVKDVSERLRVKPSTLQQWRQTGRYNLPFVKCGRLVRYRETDVSAFIEDRTIEHTGSPA